MQNEYLYYVDEWIIALVLVIILAIFFELGYFLGFKRHVRKGEKTKISVRYRVVFWVCWELCLLLHFQWPLQGLIPEN
jgi:hypothetical protein